MEIKQIGMYEDQDGNVWAVLDIDENVAFGVTKLPGKCLLSEYFDVETGEEDGGAHKIVSYHAPPVQRCDWHGKYVPIHDPDSKEFALDEVYDTRAEAAYSCYGEPMVAMLHAPLLGELVDVDDMMEVAECKASDEAGDVGVEGMYAPTAEAKRELERIIDAWAERWGLQPTYYAVGKFEDV